MVTATTRIRVMAIAVLVVAACATAAAQSEVDVAMKFFAEGGAYCFRLAPEGTNLSAETEWTVMMLTGGANHKNAYRIRAMDQGTSKIRESALNEVGLTVAGVWRRDRTREEFFDRFAAAIGDRSTRARVVKLTPPRLAEMKAGERAELYLKFADKGTRVEFDKAHDLTADEFLAFRTHLPD